MAIKTFPDFEGTGGGGGPVTFPLVGPPGAAGDETFGFTTGGGLHGTSSGGVVLSVAGTGDALSVDGQGMVALTHALRVAGLATFDAGVSTSTLSAGTITTTGNVSIGGSLGLAGSAQLTGDLSARKITASSDLSAGSLNTTGVVAGGSLNITGAATAGSLSVRGTFRADQIESDGALLFPTSSSSAPGLGLGDQPSTGIFAAPGSLGFAVAGQTVMTFASNLSATMAGSLSLAEVIAQTISSEDLAATGDTMLQRLDVVSMTASGDVVAQGNLTVAGNLDVSGTSRLANLRIDELSTDDDLTVGGDTSIMGTLSVAGNSSLTGLSASGLSTLAQVAAQRVDLTSLYMFGGPPTYEPVRREPIPNSTSTIDYVFTLDPGGEMAMSGALYVGKTLHAHGNITGDLGITGQRLASATDLQVGTNATITGGLVVGAALAATASVIGGSAFTTGSGSPSGTVVGSVGDTYMDRQSGMLYLKASGQNSNQGWVPVSTSSSALSYPLQAPASSPTQGASYAFASSTGDGMGSQQAGSLYFTTAQTQALYIDAQQNATFTGHMQAPAGQFSDLSVAASLGVGGDTSLAGLTAADTTTQALTASSLTTPGNLSAGDATLSTLQVNTDLSVGGMLAVSGDISSAGRLIGNSAVLGNSAFTTGTVAPNGQQTGSIGDLYLDRADGSAWLKTSGQATNMGWVKVSTSDSGTTFPLTAPNGSLASPSYGFTQGGLGITATGTQTLSGIVGGAAGWTLTADLLMTLAGALKVTGNATLAATSTTSLAASGALSAASIATGGALSAGSLSVSGLSQLAGLTAGNTTVTNLHSQGALTGDTTLTVAGTNIIPGSAKPADASGQQGDLAPTTSGTVPLYVRGASAWKAVAFVGDPAPTSFPLRGPADSAAAPNYASTASPGTGIYSPATNQLGFATAGVRAGSIDASQNWSIVGSLAAAAATFSSATINGTLSATGAVTFGSTLNVTGAVTLASTLSAGDITSSGKVTAQTATINGLLSAQSASTTGNVTIGGSLTVNGDTTYAGIQRTGYLQTGDGTVSAPAYSFTAETSTGIWRSAANTLAFAASSANTLTLAPALATFAGAVRVGGNNAGILSASANTLTLQTAGAAALTIAATGISTFAFQAVHASGTSSLPGNAVGQAGTGLWYGTDTFANNILGVSVAGNPAALFKSIPGSPSIYSFNLGTAASATVNGGIVASGQSPVNSVGAFPSQLFQDTRGGVGCLFLYEGTTNGSTAWAKVLTTSSTISPTYPLLATTNGSATQAVYSTASASNSGLYFLPTTFAPAVTQGGVSVAQWSQFSLGGNPSYGMFLGPGGSAGGIISGTSSPIANYNGQPAMLYQQPGAGPGSSLWVNESTSGASTTAWARVLTSSTTLTPTYPLNAPSGTVAAPSFNFNASKNSGLYYGDTPYMAVNGVQSIGFVTSIGGFANYNGIVFGPASTAGVPYIFGIPSTAPNAGNPVTNQVPAFQAAVMVNGAGAAGNQLWIHESSGATNYAAWVRVLTESTQLSFSNLLQIASPPANAGTTRISANTSNQLVATHPNSTNLILQRPPSLMATTSVTVVASDNGRIHAANANSGTTVFTLPASVPGTDLEFTFVQSFNNALQIKAPAGVIIYVAGFGTSSSGGTITATASTASIRLINMGGTAFWFAPNAPAGTFTFA